MSSKLRLGFASTPARASTTVATPRIPLHVVVRGFTDVENRSNTVTLVFRDAALVCMLHTDSAC